MPISDAEIIKSRAGRRRAERAKKRKGNLSRMREKQTSDAPKFKKRKHRDKPLKALDKVQGKFSGAQQENVLSLLCFDTEACSIIIAAVDTSLFENSVYRTIADRAYVYFRKYGEAPGDHLPDLVEEFLTSDKRSESRLYTQALNDLHFAKDVINRKYILDNLDGFVKTQTLRQLVIAAAKELQAGHTDKTIKMLLDNLAKIERPTISPLTAHCAADVKTQALSALWPGVIFQRKVTLVAGEPGLGKSLATCDIAARVSCGRNWPGGEAAVIGPANVLIISGEDDMDDTIVPRLIASDANLSNIYIIEDVVEKQDGELSVLSLDQHMQDIHARMLQHKAVLLVIDPVSAFMGDRDSHRDTSVRAMLNKLRQYAKEGNYAVLLVTHFNKPGEKVTSAIHRVMGSLGFVAAARSTYAFLRDPDDPDQRLFLPIKVNLGPDTAGFKCHIAIDRSQKPLPPQPFLKWDTKVVKGQRVDEVMSQASPREQTKKLKERAITKWLKKFLKRGWQVDSDTFNAEIKRRNFSDRTVRILMTPLGYTRTKIGFGKEGEWWVIRKRRKGCRNVRQ